MIPKRDSHMERNMAKEINIKEFFLVIKKRFWIVFLITIISASVGYYFSNHNDTPLYETSTRILIGSDGGSMNTLMVMIKDPMILENVKESLALSRSPESIASQIEIARIDDSQVILITVTDQDPKIAAGIANQTAKTYKKEVGNLLEFDDVQLLSAAKESTIPINENSNRLFMIALVFGAVTGLGLAFLLDSLDSTVRKESDVEDLLGVPVIGVVSNMKSRKSISRQKIKRQDMVRSGVIDLK